MSVTQETHDNATTFTEKLTLIMDTMDDIVHLIPEQDYLRIVNTLGSLYTDDENNRLDAVPETRYVFIHRVREHIRRDPIVTAQRTRAERPIRQKQIIRDDVWKLENGFTMCCKCDRIVQDLDTHQQSDVCKRIENSKKLAISTGEQNNTKKAKVIVKVKNALIKCGRGERNGIIG